MSLPEMDWRKTRAALLPLALVAAVSTPTVLFAQTAPAPDAKPAEASPLDPGETRPEVHKSVRLDKHAAPWTVIWHNRLWTDVPETRQFVKKTHPDPKALKYEPLIGQEPVRPKPRDPAGVAALQAELEGDLAQNAARGKAINDVSAPAPAKKAASKSARARKTAKAAAKTPKVD